MQPIEPSFFNISTLELAEKLIGHVIIHELPSGILSGRIIETEAYQGPEDRAAHSFNNRRTPRTEIMFHKAGHVYTYQMHTHTLVNVVAGPVGVPHAVLIRAIEPQTGIEQMQKNRGPMITKHNLTNGPGKLTQALAISMDYYGHHWSQRPLYISNKASTAEIERSPRVGIRNTGDAASYLWRFFEKNNPYVSKFR